MDELNDKHQENLLKKIEEISEIYSRSIEALEKQVATLAVGFVEQGVIIEALVGLVEDETEEQQKKFNTRLKQRRKEMLKVMEEGASVFSGSN